MLYSAISGGTVGKLKQVVGAAVRHRRAVTADGLRPLQCLLDFRLRIVRHAVIFIAPTTAVYRPACHRSRFLEQLCDVACTTLCSLGQGNSNTAQRRPAYDGRSSRAHAPDRRGAACCTVAALYPDHSSVCHCIKFSQTHLRFVRLGFGDRTTGKCGTNIACCHHAADQTVQPVIFFAFHRLPLDYRPAPRRHLNRRLPVQMRRNRPVIGVFITE